MIESLADALVLFLYLASVAVGMLCVLGFFHLLAKVQDVWEQVEVGWARWRMRR